ncbi:vomeronasal type-2 receptor 26-like [Hyperolius riggenbachi]|uniref:vomeronasal type-2 receptor 26-like n=1 Tax=Hyperolius riggenbachi TaxID=752182 RepID=UPI0035A35A84
MSPAAAAVSPPTRASSSTCEAELAGWEAETAAMLPRVAASLWILTVWIQIIMRTADIANEGESEAFTELQKYVRANKETRTYNEDGELSSPLIVSSLTFHKSPDGQLEPIRTSTAGTFTETSTGEMTFHINPEAITWKNGVVPVSRCNDKCSPGFRKAPGISRHVCCYECLPCAEGEISNVTDSENCQRCPDHEWPNEKKTTCIPKTLEYLSYEGDNLTLIFCIMSLLGAIITAVLLKVFTSFWDTPVVKANNRTVSIILLASILLSFLCVFLFLGCPIGITCILRQTSFGIIFSISVSCVLAKTIVVCIAFKATKPGSHWKKWVGQKLSNCVVITCSSVQVLICIIWLSVSPPYQEYDMFTSPGKINVQCNEGSMIGFYSVLGYMGFLAAVSFLLAFMVRTLPDSFNEAKYITFSTLVFCSVWIAMIPAYLSTRGKYMVAVEVFAILTSTAGFLGCMFFPKLYIILLKPELNMKPVLLNANK